MIAFINTLERLRKSDLPLCFFALSFALLADVYCGITGIPVHFERIAHASLQHWFWFGVSAFAFYALGLFLKRGTIFALIDMGAIGWIERFLDSPERRADAAEAARNSVNPNQLRILAVLHDNKTAMALVEQHQKMRLDEASAELTRQYHAFCLLLALLLEAVAQGPLMHGAWTRLPSGGLDFVAHLLFVGLLFLALYLGVVRGLTWSPKLRLYLPGHEELGLSDTSSRHESAWPYWLGREGGPKPSRPSR